MDFGDAIRALKQGQKVRRKGWNGKGIFLELQVPDKKSKMTHPYIFIDTTYLQTDNPDAPKNRVPWLASQTDMLSDDWVIVDIYEIYEDGKLTKLVIGDTEVALNKDDFKITF